MVKNTVAVRCHGQWQHPLLHQQQIFLDNRRGVHGQGARLAFGGKPLEGHSIPEVYGAIQPTAVFVPINQLLKDEHFGLATTEVFGPFQVCPLHVCLCCCGTRICLDIWCALKIRYICPC